MCEYHEEVYENIPPEVIRIIETNQVELSALIEKIGSQIAPFIFTAVHKLNETGEPVKASDEDIPEAMTRTLNSAGLLYVIAWMSSEASPTEAFDEMLSYIYANGANDGNAYVCHNKSKAN